MRVDLSKIISKQINISFRRTNHFELAFLPPHNSLSKNACGCAKKPEAITDALLGFDLFAHARSTKTATQQQPNIGYPNRYFFIELKHSLHILKSAPVARHQRLSLSSSNKQHSTILPFIIHNSLSNHFNYHRTIKNDLPHGMMWPFKVLYRKKEKRLISRQLIFENKKVWCF